jgi:hypothetical protein
MKGRTVSDKPNLVVPPGIPVNTSQEQKLIAMKDDRNPIPPTIGNSTFNNILFGPMAGQPSSSSASSSKQRSNWIPLSIILLGVTTFFLCSYFFSHPKTKAYYIRKALKR